LCEVCAEVTGMSGAGIMLMSGDVPRGSVCTTNKGSDVIEQLQYDLGEGPCVDAYHQDRPVLEPDLAEPATPRWPAFAGRAVEAGVRAIFGFPLEVGAVRLGALNLYCDRPAQLTDEQHAPPRSIVRRLRNHPRANARQLHRARRPRRVPGGSRGRGPDETRRPIIPAGRRPSIPATLAATSGRNQLTVVRREGGLCLAQMLTPPVANRATAATAMSVAVSHPRILAAWPLT
jgi:GAF domain